jgi:hypothetical protein
MKPFSIPLMALVFAFAFNAHAQSISLTPNQLGSGTLPDGYDQITFNLYDGNYAPIVLLPQKPRDNSVVIVRTQASHGVDLDTSRTDLGLGKLPLERNASYSLQFSTVSGRWIFTGDSVNHFTPNGQGATIPSSSRPITYYTLWDGDWTPAITLPTAAADQSVVVVRSNATYDAQVTAATQLFPSTTWLNTGDSYTFVYQQAQAAWTLAAAPVRRLGASDILNLVPHPTSPRTLIELWDGNWTDVIRLPVVAGDRDRITLRSQATFSSRIDNMNVNFPGTLQLFRGDEYQFMYIAATRHWEMTSSPQTVYQATQLYAANGVLPAITRPRTVVYFDDGNYVSNLTLPASHRPGDRVIVRTNATWSFTVSADGQNYPINTGEIVSFIADADNHWQKETRTIDLLLLYSDKASAKLGENAMRARLMEGLGLTNDALENSRANFRFRSVGLRQIPARASWTDLADPLGDLRDDPTVQDWRNQLRADGLYYEGTENGCGLAWVPGSDYNMVAVGSINSIKCGTNVMRHELGHNMGLEHSAGYAYAGTIMAGNSLPFYAAPYLFSDSGLPLMPAGGWDEVGAMNAFSATVAAYR